MMLGWCIGSKRIMKAISDNMPDRIVKRPARKVGNGLDEPDEDSEAEFFSGGDDEEDGQEGYGARFEDGHKALLKPSIYLTLEGRSLSRLICKQLQVDNPKDVFDIRFLYNRNVREELGITVGTNRKGCLDERSISRVKQFFSIKEDPQWFLAYEAWRWTSK
jgi:hypothetical protein